MRRRTEQSQFTHTYPAYLPSARQKEMNIRKVKVGLAVKQLKDILKKKKKKTCKIAICALRMFPKCMLGSNVEYTQKDFGEHTILFSSLTGKLCQIAT